MDNCIFCKIAKREIPADIVYEDNDFSAFLDIQPISHGHTLIIPKAHIVWMQDADDEMISGIFKLSKKLMLAVKKAFNSDYVQVSVVGKDVPHFHVHLMPRYLNDGLLSWEPKKYKGEEAKEVAEKIKNAIA